LPSRLGSLGAKRPQQPQAKAGVVVMLHLHLDCRNAMSFVPKGMVHPQITCIHMYHMYAYIFYFYF